MIQIIVIKFSIKYHKTIRGRLTKYIGSICFRVITNRNYYSLRVYYLKTLRKMFDLTFLIRNEKKIQNKTFFKYMTPQLKLMIRVIII